MGIRGLTTFLQENQRVLCKTLNLPSGSPVPLVVDGWSFIYDIHRHSNSPWVYGGEYEEFHHLISKVVQAWIKVGFRLYFVFDGPCPPLKFSTLSSRLYQSHVQPALLFFRTSSISRETPRFLNETRIIPPLLYTTCIRVLQQIRLTTHTLEIHFADEEGDPYAVELASRIGGYVAGNDSDFVVLNTDGYLGYIPLNEITWYTSATTSLSEKNSDDEFQTVQRSKAPKGPANNTTVGRGIIPPVIDDQLALSFKVYSPGALAAHLKIPISLLPLLGALIGNDYSTSDPSFKSIQSMFFGRQLTSTQRIYYVANTIRAILSPLTSHKRYKQKHQLGSVMDLIDRSVHALLPHSVVLGPVEIEKVVDKIVDATLQYAIPTRPLRDNHEEPGLPSTEACALHEPKYCPFLPLISRVFEMASNNGDSKELSNAIAARANYLNAYRKGQLSPKIMDILNSATFWPRLFLENPDLETVGRSIGRPLREWGYAIIHNTVGLTYMATENISVEDQEPDNNSDDELIDVVESDDESGEDLLAPLKGQLQLLHGSNKENPRLLPTILHPQQHLRRHTITEHIRRGTRIAEEIVTVRPLHELMSSISASESHQNGDISTPLLLWPQEDRLTVLLQILGSDIPPVRALSFEQLTLILSLRWVIRITHERAQTFHSKDRDSERWSKREARCFLASFNWKHLPDDKLNLTTEFPPIANRNMQLMAQALMALESVEHLSQVFLLSEMLPSPAYMLSGRAFHRNLTTDLTLEEFNIPPLLWEACSCGLGDAFREDVKKKSKKMKDVRGREIEGPQRKQKAGPNSLKELFKLLNDVEV